MRWTGKAAKEGYGLILHLDSQTRTKIDEFSTAGFIGVRKNREGWGMGSRWLFLRVRILFRVSLLTV
jgi:hypothetical protein